MTLEDPNAADLASDLSDINNWHSRLADADTRYEGEAGL